MKVFISWSGERSQILARALHDWLPLVLHYVKPWLSEADIAAGERWAQAVAEELESSNFGIICVTPENLGTPWILFEAGALAKSIQGARVVPLIFNLEFNDISGPLCQFQAKKPDRGGLAEVVNAINQSAEQPLQEGHIRQLFAALWPKFEKVLRSIPEDIPVEKGMRLDPRLSSYARQEKIEGRRLFEYKGLYPVDIAPRTNLPSLNSEIYVKAIRYFLQQGVYDRLATMDLVYLREDNRHHLGDVLPTEATKLYERLIGKYSLEEFKAKYSQETRRLFRNIERVINDLGDTLAGVNFEILLHDVRNPLRSVIALKNTEEVSGRRLYDPSTRFVVQYVRHQGKHLIEALEGGSKVAYLKQFTQAKKVKATTTPLYDEQYGLIGLLCFNIDVEAVENFDEADKIKFFSNYARVLGETPSFELEDAPVLSGAVR